MPIRAITFDFGNVVGYFDYRPALRQLSSETGIAEPAIVSGFLDAELEEEFESGRISPADFLERVRRRLGLTLSDDELIPRFTDIFQPNHEVAALIARLRGRYRLLLGSNTNELHARQFRRQFADTLAHFDHLVLSHEVGHRKPRPEFFSHCLKQARAAPEECVFIDDLPANLEGAKQCGWQVIHYLDFADLQRRLAELGVTID